MYLYTYIYTHTDTLIVMCIDMFPLLFPTIILELLYLLKPGTGKILLETPLDLLYIRLAHVQAFRLPRLSRENIRSFTPHYTATSCLLKHTTLKSLQK